MESESDYPLTQLSILEHESDSETETATSDIGPRLSTQQILGIVSDSEPEHSTPDSPPPPPPPSPSNSNIAPQVIDIRPNSTQENSSGRRRVPFLPITQDAVLEHYVLTRAIDHSFGPKYETYNAKSARLETFVIHDWPHMLDLPPNTLSEAGISSQVRFSQYIY